MEKNFWNQRIEAIDKAIEEGYSSDEILVERLEIFSKVNQRERKNFDDCAQKYKNKWCLEGDENSAMFHRNLNKKKHVRAIKGVDIDSSWETEPYKVKEFFKTSFENNFKVDPDCTWEQNLGETNKISRDESESIEKMFEENELKEAIWSCGANKSPGPDGFSIEFFKHFWEFLKIELLEAFNDFATYPKIPKGVNAAFITLIPKKQNPLLVNDFRPISLVSSIYKILSKMLAGRLKKVLPNIIDKTQSAFIKDRQILDGLLIVNEVLD